MFLIVLLMSIVISFAIMQKCGHFSLVILMAIAYFSSLAYQKITKKFHPGGATFELKFSFALLLGGIVTGIVFYCIYFNFQAITDFILPQ